MAGVGQIAVVDGQVLEPRIGGLDEDLRLVSGGAQHALDAQHLVTDGVAVAEGREHLMHRGPPCLSIAPSAAIGLAVTRAPRSARHPAGGRADAAGRA